MTAKARITMDFVLECNYTRWVFRPCSQRGRRWLELNLYPRRLEVEKSVGQCIYRALHADGFDVEHR
jgi:hypothetical protein